ncbi:hypothetical protein A2U01_0018574 [Trifolium medium]|uniref:Retrotransposon gag domain-containing protein n=1 Tax=Trifolium medium TaxID=97028 RepID=A0A392NEF4_9FABA|nr:hypothetical protein [Trifolium medium]
MDLDRVSVSSFNDLASAFIRQYNYNSYLAPDRDELRALAQKGNESFKEYAQRWRELATQIRPPVEEKELCKLFLHTLSPFYYEKMVASVTKNFTEMVEIGMRLEEGVRQGRLTREDALAKNTKRFGNVYPRKEEQKVGMFARGEPQSGYPIYPHITAVSTIPQQLCNQSVRAQRKQSFDPIPMKYADLLPALLAKKLVHTKPPPPAPEKLPAWYHADLTCAFHQGAPGHDVEQCYALRKEVQNLVRTNMLSFNDPSLNVQSSLSA